MQTECFCQGLNENCYRCQGRGYYYPHELREPLAIVSTGLPARHSGREEPTKQPAGRPATVPKRSIQTIREFELYGVVLEVRPSTDEITFYVGLNKTVAGVIPEWRTQCDEVGSQVLLGIKQIAEPSRVKTIILYVKPISVRSKSFMKVYAGEISIGRSKRSGTYGMVGKIFVPPSLFPKSATLDGRACRGIAILRKDSKTKRTGWIALTLNVDGVAKSAYKLKSAKFVKELGPKPTCLFLVDPDNPIEDSLIEGILINASPINLLQKLGYPDSGIWDAFLGNLRGKKYMAVTMERGKRTFNFIIEEAFFKESRVARGSRVCAAICMHALPGGQRIWLGTRIRGMR